MKKEYNKYLNNLKDPLYSLEAIYYIDRSQGNSTNSIALVKYNILQGKLNLVLTKSQNLGLYIEVYNTEEYAIFRTLKNTEKTAKSKKPLSN